MGLLTTICAVERAETHFVAANFASIQAGPQEDCGGLNPVHIERLHQIITGESESTVSSYYAQPVYMESEEGPWVLAVPSVFVEKFLAFSASLAPVAARWAATEEMQADRWQPSAALLLLSRMQNFLRQTVQNGKAPLLIISL